MQAFASSFIMKWCINPEESDKQFMKEVLINPSSPPSLLTTVKIKP